MAGKQMKGDNEELRRLAREAREHGKEPSEVGASRGADKQRSSLGRHGGDSHQKRLDQTKEGKPEGEHTPSNIPVARPGRARDDDTPDREQFPRM